MAWHRIAKKRVQHLRKRVLFESLWRFNRIALHRKAMQCKAWHRKETRSASSNEGAVRVSLKLFDNQTLFQYTSVNELFNRSTFDLEIIMTIEAKLDRIIELLEARTPVAVPAPVAAPAPVGNVQPATTPSAPVTATPVVPVAQATPATASPSSCPITDQPSLIAYVMASYKEMGPVKGNQIQGVLAALGIGNINEAKPEQYAAIHTGVEALKAQ